MMNQSIIDKMIEMRLKTMSSVFIAQLNDSRMKEVDFKDCFGMSLILSTTIASHLRLISNDGLNQIEVYIADIEYSSKRKRNRHHIEIISTCEYNTENWNLLINGKTGCGKM